MEFCIVNADGIIENIIVSDEAFAAEIGALSSYDGAAIGGAYAPPEPEPELEPEEESSVWDELAAAYTEGVNSAYEQ